MFPPHRPHSLSTSSRRASRGFSLTETLVTVCICGTLASIAVPSWRSATHSMKLTSVANSFSAHVHLARSEAIKRNARVVLCKSGQGTSCETEGNWAQGWIVFHDANNNGAADTGERVIGSFGALPDGYRFSGNTPVASYLSYTGTGTSKTTSGAFQAGTFTLCREGDAPAEAREIAINALGRPKIRKTSLASC